MLTVVKSGHEGRIGVCWEERGCSLAVGRMTPSSAPANQVSIFWGESASTEKIEFINFF